MAENLLGAFKLFDLDHFFPYSFQFRMCVFLNFTMRRYTVEQNVAIVEQFFIIQILYTQFSAVQRQNAVLVGDMS